MAGKKQHHRTPGELLDALKRANGVKKLAAELCGLGEMTYARHLREAFPEGPPTEVISGPPEGHNLHGVSTLVDAEGNIRAQWIKSRADPERQLAAARAAVEELSKSVAPQKPIAPPRGADARLCNVYTLTDCHVGALAWDRETGANWDLEIAERTITECFRIMVESARPAEMAVVNQLGDFLHFDSLEAVTPRSKHILDADSRYQKVVETAVRILRLVVNLAAARHRRVLVLMHDANHDPVGGTWLRAMFAALYERDKRVTVETSPKPYIAHQWGRTMLAFHHGHMAKMEKLPGVFAAEYPQVWGATTRRYCHTGHWHHTRMIEDAGMIVEQHPTLAARDAFAARLGLHALRQVHGITYHDEHGQVGRVTVHPEMAVPRAS